MYKEFAEIYDNLVFDIDYDFYYALIEQAVQNNNISTDSILEIGIGTGKLTEKIAKKSKLYYGIDISEEMLSLASERLKNIDNISLICANIVDFKIVDFFDLIFSTLDTMNYILKSEDLIKSFENIYNSLKKDSLFIFDLNSENKLRNVLGNNSYIYEYENIFYTWQNFLDEEENIVDFVLDFFIEEDGLYRRITEEQSEKIYTNEFILKTLKEVGFQEINYIDFDTGEKVDSNTQRILFVSKK